MSEFSKLPLHVGIIMDGNGRWAKKRGLSRSLGHAAGMRRMISLAAHAKEVGVKYLTVYALSTENLSRPQEELDGLFGLIKTYFSRNVKKLFKQGAAVRIIGDTSVLPKEVHKLLTDAEKKSPENAEFTMTFAINYGSRSEILRAANAAVREGRELTEEDFLSHLYTRGLPDPDLIIRTGGELRLSNFLTYQAAYAELYFTDALFPDFTNRKFDRALEEYAGRERRFGKTEE